MHKWEENRTKEKKGGGREEEKRTNKLINLTGKRHGYRQESVSRGDEEGED